MIDSAAINSSIDRAQHVVLVVDDNAATRYSTSRILQVAGFRTIEAGSGSQALVLAQEGPSAVVLDVHLPDISGFDVCRQLRADPATATLPIVHLSAEFTRNEDRVAGLDAGADGYLVHPVEPAVLVATLQALVRARTAEDRWRRSELRFRAVYDHAPNGILLLGPDGVIVDANPAMAKLLDLPAPSLLGRRLADLVVPEAREGVLEQTTTRSGTLETWQGQFALLGARGARLQLEWSLSAHVDPGVRIAIARDVTERLKLEEQRVEVLEREQAARAAAERHSRTKDDFIAVLSHELRTPLNAIVGWVAVLLRRDPPAGMVKGLEAIDRNVRAQARIISDILDVSRINSGKLRLEREEIDPAAVVESAVASMGTSLDDRKLRVELDIEQARQPAWLDAARFQQILWNLMTNAIKFSREGGLIQVALTRAGDVLSLSVRDHGQGIQAEFIPRLFDRFSQSASPGHRVHGGLGLGLSIVRHLAELHGGSVRAESAGLDQGTVMHVELRVADPGAEDAVHSQPGALHPLDEPHDGDSLEGLRVLVVEDDADAGEMLSMILTDRGASVRTAVDCDSALAAVRHAWPDLVVSDIGLPLRDGHELVRELRAMETAGALARTPALALTAFARAEDRRKALDAGFDDHLAKPLNANALISAIRALRAGAVER